MKLVIQIPCYNEEELLPRTIADLPKRIEGVDVIETLIIDDGSSDGTVEVARKYGVTHIERLATNQGLARAFAAGLDASLRTGADIIVNTDADNQYRGGDIVRLVKPILMRQADIVVGARDIRNIAHFSFMKKILQRIGSSLIRKISGTTIPDVTSGFRAYSREAAMRINVLSEFTYTLETIIQAGSNGLKITHVPIQTNEKLRDSRLFSSIGEYLGRSLSTIIRIYTMYNPLKVFSAIAGVLVTAGVVLVLRFFYFYFTLEHVQSGHVQSLIIAAIVLVIGFQIFLFGLLADLIAKNRKLMDEALLRIKKIELVGSDKK
jgi:glycosyltransferase involved in cell wall biosynthesis